MIKALVICAIMAISSAQQDGRYRPVPQYHHPGYYHARNVRYDVDGVARDHRLNMITDETPKPYSFSYSAPNDDGVGSSSRNEVADGNGRVEGSYTVTNDEGHTRVVDYVADEGGFRATVRTNEPGTSNQSPASVILESSAPSQYSYNPEARYRPRTVAAVRTGLEEPVVVDQPIDAAVVPVVPRHRTVHSHRPYYPVYGRNSYYY